MSKNRYTRAKGAKRRAYLRHNPGGYNPHNPYALRNRNGRVINLYGQIPDTVMRGDAGKAVIGGREAGLAIELWQSARRQGFRKFHRISLGYLKGQYRIELWFEGEEFYFVKENYAKQHVAISFKYNSHNRAMHAFTTNSVRWKQITAFNFSDSEEPSG